LGGVAGLIEHQLAAGILLLLSALIVFPPASAFLQRQVNFPLPAWSKAGGAIVLLLLGAALLPKARETPISTQSEAGFVPSAQGIAVAKLLLLDDFKEYLEGNKVVGDWSGTFPLGQKVSASQLFAAYHDNEVAADEQYKGKPLVVIGSVDSINKDMFENGFLVLRDQNAFEGVHANLTGESMKTAGKLSPGQEVTLICTGQGMILGSPVVKDCDTTGVMLSQKQGTVQNMVDQFFANDRDQPPSIRMMIGFSYAAGTALPGANACQTAAPGEMQNCTQALHAIPAAEQKSRYLELSKHFALPSLPDTSQKP
jgi:hypothetical protein